MLVRQFVTKALQASRYTAPALGPTHRFFSSLTQAKHLDALATAQNNQVTESKNLHLTSYMKNLFKWTTIGTTVGMASAFLGSFLPMGFSVAYLILSGAAADHIGNNSLEKSRPQVVRVKDENGKSHYDSVNPLKRKIAFLASAIGASLLAAPALSFLGTASIVMPYCAAMSIFSAMGHYQYSRMSGKTGYKPWQAALYGMAAGYIGLSLIGIASPALMGGEMLLSDGDMFYSKTLNIGSYLSLGLYNLFVADDARKVAEDLKQGKDDYLKHGTKFVENWMLTLVPFVLFS
jgi:hypothetical protein